VLLTLLIVFSAATEAARVLSRWRWSLRSPAAWGCKRAERRCWLSDLQCLKHDAALCSKHHCERQQHSYGISEVSHYGLWKQ